MPPAVSADVLKRRQRRLGRGGIARRCRGALDAAVTSAKRIEPQWSIVSRIQNLLMTKAMVAMRSEADQQFRRQTECCLFDFFQSFCCANNGNSCDCAAG